MTKDVFQNYYDNILLESIEEAMSPEDAHDSELIKSIIDKTYERTNAKLTPQEQEVLKKYNLSREHQNVLVPGITKHYTWSDAELDSLEGGNKRERGHRKRYANGEKSMYPSSTNHDRSQVNFADIARKRPERDAARLNRLKSDKISQYQDAQRDLKNALWYREYHQEYLDNADKSYFDALQKAKKQYDDAVAAANQARDKVDTYHTPQRDAAQTSINKIYDRFKR